jgi:hypothetical protein
MELMGHLKMTNCDDCKKESEEFYLVNGQWVCEECLENREFRKFVESHEAA